MSIMKKSFGAGNTAAFSSSISSGYLPSTDHLTYDGLFNEIDFPVGPKTEDVIDIAYGFARVMNPNSLDDSKVNDYLALFLKGNTDGQPRDQRVLNSVIALDISGSMSGPLQRTQKAKNSRSRLDLCKEAIKMFVSKLRPSDTFGLVLFNTAGHVLIPIQQREYFDLEKLFSTINQIQINGGTTIKNGISVSFQCLQSLSNTNQACENRLVLLTDVMDPSLSQEKTYLEHYAQKGIHTTIIGISEDFQSSICEVFKNIKGFNYFSATQDDDLKKYLFENFDYTFFPSTYDVKVTLESPELVGVQVFGTPDAKQVQNYNKFLQKDTFLITKMGTSFPSDISIKEGQMHTFGGLILIKLRKKNEEKEQFLAKIKINCLDINMNQISKQYDIKYIIPGKEQFFSSDSVQQAMDSYQYVSEIKCLINQVNEKKADYQQYTNRWIQSLGMLEKICPASKVDELSKIKKIIYQIMKIEQ